MLSQENGKARRRELEIFIPAGPRLGNLVIEAKGVSKGFGDNILVDERELQLMPPGRHRGHHRPQRRGQDHACSA